MRYRVVESVEGKFYPQFKSGLFSFWKLYSNIAERHIDSGMMLQRLIETDDPVNAVCFNTMEEAKAFELRIDTKAQEYWANDAAKRAREIHGVNVKKVYKNK